MVLPPVTWMWCWTIVSLCVHLCASYNILYFCFVWKVFEKGLRTAFLSFSSGGDAWAPCAHSSFPHKNYFRGSPIRTGECVLQVSWPLYEGQRKNLLGGGGGVPLVADQESGMGCPQDFSHSWFGVGGVEQVERSDPQFWLSSQPCWWKWCCEGRRQSVWKELRNLSAALCWVVSVRLNLG